MLTEVARVVAVEGDSIWVETVRQSVCGSCAASKGCGHGLLNRLGDGRRSYLQLSSAGFPPDKFKVDDQVSLAIPEQLLLRGSFIVYLLPLACTLAAAALAATMLPAMAELASVLGAAAGFAAGVGLVRLHAHSRRHSAAMQPQLLGIAGSGPG